MKYFFTLLPLCFTCIMYSQNFEINGKIVDDNDVPLESATIYVEKVSDSSMVTYSVSERNGDFRLLGKTQESKVILTVSYTGYKSFREIIEVEKELNLDPITLSLTEDVLGEVTITASSPPVTMKKDTLEYNADSFTTRPDANLEELMKRLPGVEVDNEGNITVNGRPVTRFLVNGEEFFGDDHKIATKNLPKEIIDKIQVVDTKTRSQEFTGEAGDPDNKTVNITIKEDKNKGYFARATAGGGTDDRYELSGIGNYFKNDLRLSILASSNNINSSGFSYDEVYGMMGRTAGRNVFGGNGGGITKAETAGFNFVNKWEEDFRLNADYFFGRNDTERRTTVARENILPNSRYFTNSEDASNLINDSHRASARLEIQFDTLTRLSIRPRFNSNYGQSYRTRIAESLDEDYNLINNTSTLENEQLERENLGNNLDFIKRLGGRGAYLQLRLSNNHNRQRNNNFYYSESIFFENDEEVQEIQDQFIDEDENSDSYSLNASNRSVLAENFFLNVSYNFDYSNSTNKRYVYEAENGDGNYNTLNELLSNDFEVTSMKHTPNVGLNYEGDIWRINTNVGLLNTSLDNENFLEETTFKNTYNNLFLTARVRYEIERSKNFSLRYGTSVDIPSIRQLQPVEDRTNPLNIVMGNPELQPAYMQRIDIDFRNFDFATRTGFATWIDIRFTDNTVVPITTVDEDLVRYTTYTNVDGVMNAGIGGAYNKQIKRDEKEFRFRAALGTSYNRNKGFTNAVKYTAERYSLNPSIRLTYAIDELFDLNPNYSLSYNSTNYDINPNRNEEVYNHRIGFSATTYWPKNVIFGNDISYNHFGNVSPGFDNTSILWNLSLGYQFLKDSAILKVQVYDLLDQNVDTRRVIGDDFIQDTRNLILTRYAMLSFTYKINQFGGQPGDRGRRGRR